MATPGGKRHRILLVDDNPNLLQLMVHSFQLLGDYEVITAENGIEGLERVQEAHPDCIVIDVKMPGLNGCQLVRALRGDPATTYIPLIMLTAMVQEKDRYEGLASGADRYLVKPIKPLALVTAIQEAIRISEEERARSFQSLAEAPPPELTDE
jgi:two-component system, cell cycle response regulator